jgi:hypothetical protein
MMQIVDSVRFEAFVRLLAQPDPTDLPRRRHTFRYPGDPDRRATRLPGILMGWLQRRHLAVDLEEPLGAPTRVSRRFGRQPNPGLHMLRPTGTDN